MKKGLVLTGTEIIGKLIKEMVKNLFLVEVATSFQDFKNNLSSEKYDFIIIDRTLKDCSAKDIFINLIKENIENIPPSILLVQERYNPEKDGDKYNFILRKPFVKDEIVEAINFVLLEKDKKQLKKIMIIDDSPTSRKVLKKILKSGGFQCYEAENALQGIEKVQEILPDLIIVDYVMPDLTGIEFARKISENEKLKTIPVILISGSQKFNKIIEEGFNSGISAYFRKPVKEEEIFNFFSKYFQSEISSKILILDDSSTRRKVLYSSLSINNNQVITTNTIDKAIAILEDNSFDLILVDLILKNETGFDAVKAIRKVEKNIPIIVYSSIGDRKNVYKVLELGASDFLWAPIEMRELLLKVKIWLGYSKFLKLKENYSSKIKRIAQTATFIEEIDSIFAHDKLNGIISSLVYFDKINIDLKQFIRKSDKIGKHNGNTFVYFQQSNLVNTLKICERIKKISNENFVYGIATTDSVETVEKLFQKAKENIIV